ITKGAMRAAPQRKTAFFISGATSLVCSSETSIGLENPAEPSQASPHPRYLGRGRRAASRDRPCDPRAQPEDERSRRETAGRSPEAPWGTHLGEPPSRLHRSLVGGARR